MARAVDTLADALDNSGDRELRIKTALNMLKLILGEHETAMQALLAVASGLQVPAPVIEQAAKPITPLDSQPEIRQL